MAFFDNYLKFSSLLLFHSKESSFFLVLLFFLSEFFLNVFLNSLFELLVADKIRMEFDFFVNGLNLINAGKFHSVVPESVFSSLSDVRYFFHGLNSFDIQLSIVLNGFISFLFELKNGIVSYLFAMNFSISFCPGEFSWIMFGFEVFVTFSTTEFENFTIVTNESHSMAWINRT